MNRATGYVMIGVGIAIAMALYALRNPLSGPKVPNAGSGASRGNANDTGSTPGGCGSDLCLGIGAGLDGSTDPVAIDTESQTEAAYQQPTEYSDAFGDVNSEGDEVTYA